MKFKFEVSEGDGYEAYLKLPEHPHFLGIPDEKVKVVRTVSLTDLLGNYKGPDIVFDFDKDDKMIGVEFVADDPNEDNS